MNKFQRKNWFAEFPGLKTVVRRVIDETEGLQEKSSFRDLSIMEKPTVERIDGDLINEPISKVSEDNQSRFESDHSSGATMVCDYALWVIFSMPFLRKICWVNRIKISPGKSVMEILPGFLLKRIDVFIETNVSWLAKDGNQSEVEVDCDIYKRPKQGMRSLMSSIRTAHQTEVQKSMSE